MSNSGAPSTWCAGFRRRVRRRRCARGSPPRLGRVMAFGFVLCTAAGSWWGWRRPGGAGAGVAGRYAWSSVGQPSSGARVARIHGAGAGGGSGRSRRQARAQRRARLLPGLGSTLGWRAVGQRVDRLAGVWRSRSITNGRAAGCVHGPGRSGAQAARGPRVPRRRDSAAHAASRRPAGRDLASRGDTCVLSGADVSASELQELAAWMPAGT